MIAPVLPRLARTALQVMDDAGLVHEAQRWTVVRVRQPGGTYLETKVLGDVSPARLNPLAADDPMRADQPASARLYWLSLPAGTTVRAGDNWLVSGSDGYEDWAHTLHVNGVEVPRSEEQRRRALVVDTATNP